MSGAGVFDLQSYLTAVSALTEWIEGAYSAALTLYIHQTTRVKF